MSSRLLPQLSPPMSKKSTDMVINVNQGTSKSSISSDIIHTDFDMTGIEKSCAQAVLAAARRRRVERATAATESIKKSLSEGGVGMVIRDSSDKLARSARLLLVKSSQARTNASQARIRAEKSFGWASKTIEGNRALVVARRSGDKAAEVNSSAFNCNSSECALSPHFRIPGFLSNILARVSSLTALPFFK